MCRHIEININRCLRQTVSHTFRPQFLETVVAHTSN